jgi:hypothetical protein
MSVKDLKDSLGKNISPMLVDELLKDFVDIRRHYISSDYRSLLAKSGTFSETAVQILIYLSENKIISTKEIKISELEKRLANANLNPSLKTIIPRMLITLYNLTFSVVWATTLKERIRKSQLFNNLLLLFSEHRNFVTFFSSKIKSSFSYST